MVLVKTILKNTVVLTVAKTASMAFGLLLLSFIVRSISIEDFGLYSFAFAFTAFFVIAFGLGLDFLVVREVAKKKELVSEYLGNIFFIKLVAAAVLLVVIIALLVFLGVDEKTFYVTVIVALALFFQSFSQSFTCYFQAFQKMEFEALVVGLQSVLFFSIAIAALFYGFGLFGLVHALLLSNAIIFLLSFFLVTKKICPFTVKLNPPLWRPLLLAAFPFLLIGLLDSVFSQVNIVFLSFLAGSGAVAFFSAPYRLIIALTIVQSNFFIALFPVLSEFFHRGKDSFQLVYERAFKYLLVVSLPLVAFVFLFSPKIIALFFGAKYLLPENPLLDSATALRLLVLVVPFWFAGSLVNYALFSANKQKIVAFSLALAAIASIVLNYLVVPSMKVAGAVLVLIVASFISFVVPFAFATAKVCKARASSAFLKTLAATFVMSLFSFYGLQYSLAANIIIAFFSYAIALVAFGLFDETDLKLLKQLFSVREPAKQGNTKV